MESPTDLRLPRYQQLRDEMCGRIARQEWKPGEPIPTEQELAGKYRVAVGTVRKAVDVLVSEGMLERFQGRGTFVRRARFDGSLFRFFRFQSASGKRIIPTGRILKREEVPAPDEVAEALKLQPGDRVIRMARLRLIGEEPVLTEDIWLPWRLFRPLMSVATEEIGDLLYPEYEERCGHVIASASETLTVELAGRVHARQLRIEPGTPVVVIERLAYAFDRRPLEWRRSRGPATSFRYHVEIR
jgi:GntR family transcriptional regulator